MIRVGATDLKVIAELVETLNKLDTSQEGSIGIYMDVYRIPLVSGEQENPEDLFLLGWAHWDEGAWVFQAASEDEDEQYRQEKIKEKEAQAQAALNIGTGILRDASPSESPTPTQ